VPINSTNQRNIHGRRSRRTQLNSVFHSFRWVSAPEETAETKRPEMTALLMSWYERGVRTTGMKFWKNVNSIGFAKIMMELALLTLYAFISRLGRL